MINPYNAITMPEHWESEKRHEYFKIISSFTTFDISTRHQQWILKPLHDEETWDWYRDCNGANVVSEPGWIGKYSPPYIRHDYDWLKYGATLKSNQHMAELQIAYGMDPWRSNLRWFGVTAFGLPYYKTVAWIKSWF